MKPVFGEKNTERKKVDMGHDGQAGWREAEEFISSSR